MQNTSRKAEIDKFITTLSEPPTIDIKAYFEQSAEWELECLKVAASLHKFGILVVRDPRVSYQMNDDYIDMVERYFEDIGERYYRGEALKDCRPELSYQTGVTPASVEKARDHQLLVESIPDTDKPLSPFPPEYDAKWRFFWPIGERPEEVRNDLPKVIPEDYPEWEDRMNSWGNHMVNATETIAEMAAIGMGLEKNTFRDRMKLAPHLLAPTASDLQKSDVGTAFAGFHYDLNFLTCHGRSRFPGLFLWTRDWKKMSCQMPQGCLLMQAGAMFEALTGGYVLAGYHEVIYTQATKDALLAAKKEQAETGKKRSHWRISSTLFSHLRYNVDVAPLREMGDFYGSEALEKYPSKSAHDLLCEELAAINLAPKQSYCDLSVKSVTTH